MTIEKIINKETNSLSEIQQVMSENNSAIHNAKYYADLRRNSAGNISLPKTQADQNKEPYVVVKGYDVASGQMIAEDKNTGKTFPARVLSDGPLAVDSRVMGFPPGPGESQGAIRGPMKGKPIPPIEVKKKRKKQVEEVTEELIITVGLNVRFLSKGTRS